MGQEGEFFAVSGCEASLGELVPEDSCGLVNRGIQVFVIEGQHQVEAAGVGGLQSEAGHIAGIADDPVDDQQDALRPGDFGDQPGGTPFYITALPEGVAQFRLVYPCHFDQVEPDRFAYASRARGRLSVGQLVHRHQNAAIGLGTGVPEQYDLFAVVGDGEQAFAGGDGLLYLELEGVFLDVFRTLDILQVDHQGMGTAPRSIPCTNERGYLSIQQTRKDAEHIPAPGVLPRSGSGVDFGLKRGIGQYFDRGAGK